MSQPQFSAAPMDPYEWRESVLSTRSLSYLSTDGLGGLQTHSRTPSYSYIRPQPRRRTLTGTSEHSEDDGLVMASMQHNDGGLNNIPELPESVAASPLFILPREIRDKVYACCLTAQNGLPVEWPPLPGAGSSLYALQPQLLRACRIMYDETAPLLYSLNTMTFHHPSDANMFVRAIAASTLARNHVTSLSLHIKAVDTRLWMPYLTSGDAKRSLKADYPHLRELGIRYRSNKWSHSHSPDQNLKVWSEDSRLDEIMDGLRNVFLSQSLTSNKSEDHLDGVKPLNEMNAEEFMRFVDARRPGEDMAFKRHLLELHKAHVPAAARSTPEPPTIKVVCACRVHSTHFNIVTSGLEAVSAANNPPPPPPVPVPHPAPVLGMISQVIGVGGPPPEDPIIASDLVAPVEDGEPFKGFSAVDFSRDGIKRLHDPDLGSAKVARTPFADKNGIMIALEIHCLDTKKDGPATA